MTWAVHGLDRIKTVFRLDTEHLVGKLVSMTRSLPQTVVNQLRRANFQIAVRTLQTLHIGLDSLINCPAFGMPEHHPWSFLLEMEELQLFTNLAMVAFLSLFQSLKVLIQGFFITPGGTINTLQHFVLGVTTPIGSGNGSQLERLKFSSIGDVGASTEIDEFALAIKRDIFIAMNAANNLNFVLFAHPFEHGNCITPAHQRTMNRQIFQHNLAHFFFNFLKIFRRKWTRIGKVIEESIVYDWANRNLGLREQSLYCLSHQMGARMSYDRKTIRIAISNDGQFTILVNHEGRINQYPIYTTSQRCTCQARPYRRSNISNAQRQIKVARASIRQSNCGHGIPGEIKKESEFMIFRLV